MACLLIPYENRNELEQDYWLVENCRFVKDLPKLYQIPWSPEA